MAKKSYQLKGDHSAFQTTVNSEGKQVVLTPDDDSYETDDPAEQDALDAAAADPGSGLTVKSAAKGEKS